VRICYILYLTYSTTKRKVGSNRDQLTPFSALLDPPDSSETYSSTTKSFASLVLSLLRLLTPATMAYQFVASQPTPGRNQKEIERSL